MVTFTVKCSVCGRIQKKTGISCNNFNCCGTRQKVAVGNLIIPPQKWEKIATEKRTRNLSEPIEGGFKYGKSGKIGNPKNDPKTALKPEFDGVKIDRPEPVPGENFAGAVFGAVEDRGKDKIKGEIDIDTGN